MKKNHKIAIFISGGVIIVAASLFAYFYYFNHQVKTTDNKPSEINYCLENHDQGLIDKVKAQPKVKEFLGLDFPVGNTPKVEVDNKANNKITIHVYEIVAENDLSPSHTATMDWYYLNCKGEITGTMSGEI